MERFADAAQTYDKLTRLIPDESQLWADYADVLAMTSGKSLLGAPTKLLEKALALNPANLKALALSGSAAMERDDMLTYQRIFNDVVTKGGYLGSAEEIAKEKKINVNSQK